MADVLCECGKPASVHAHTSPHSSSGTVPRCKARSCSRVCPHCWQHFTPEVIDAHIHQDAGFGRGCAAGPAPDPLREVQP